MIRSPVTTRLGRRFVLAALGVLAVALAFIVVAARSMFISSYDLRLLMWALLPAIGAAAVVALLVARPIADDANRICDAAMRVADGDLAARTGVRRNDELGEAAEMFDVMVERLGAVEQERALMLSAVSHDLRTPLAALRAAVEALRDGVVDDSDRYLVGMERQVRALAALVDDLQLHARIASGTLDLQPGRIDLTELADESIEVVRPLADHHDVDVLLEADERVWITGDPTQLARVIRNLLENAIRHAPAATVVLVQVRGQGVGAASGLGGEAVVRVVDQGDGFPPELVESAFEAFTRGDPSRSSATGTAGLGLAIARGIVGAHHGTVGVVPGAGGIVEIRLPR
ncbi:MAG: HAMP domain-containing sensor histidine kinase [Ilumatobacteraceae bacterium]